MAAINCSSEGACNTADACSIADACSTARVAEEHRATRSSAESRTVGGTCNSAMSRRHPVSVLKMSRRSRINRTVSYTAVTYRLMIIKKWS